MTRYEHTQIGHVVIWSLLVGAVLFASGGLFESSSHRESFRLGSVVLLLILAVFYKLTITIGDEALRWSFGVGIIRKNVRIAEIGSCEPIRIK